MLAQLAIRDIVLIERLEIDFRRGLTVLTGETGAGKSILLDALALALGGRGDGGLVRHGADQGQVTAVFDVANDHPARAVLSVNEIDADGDIIVRRIQTTDGRTRAFVNDQAVSVSLLKTLGNRLVEIHGQHDDRALVEPAEHRRLLDAFGGLEVEVAEVTTAWKTWRAAEKALAEQSARIETARREADYLRASVDELTKLKPTPGEETELAALRARLQQSEKVASDIAEAVEILGGNTSPIPVIAALWRKLERKAAGVPGPLDGAVKPLAGALDQLEEARQALEAALRAADFDPKVLERTEERLFALRGAARKFGVRVDDLAALAARMASDLADLDAGEDKLVALDDAARAAAERYRVSAVRLTARRIATATALEAAVHGELPALKLERAKFIVERRTEDSLAGPEGSDEIEFWVQTNPGTRPGPMMKVASGGELSRFLLALKVSLADRGSAPTLVFDEIDTGVGGAVAEAIGGRLARLSDRVQVLSVTHAPQVAARAASHLLIAKEAVGAERVVTRVTPLDGAARREEIARMLAGATISEEARRAADRLIAGTG
jgi:DNA repair protein RecN (Recombination protein N)